MDPQPQPIGSVAEPRLHPIGPARRRREVPALLAQRADEPVVEDVARLVEGEEVARHPGSQVVEAGGERRVHQRRGVGTGDEELRERADVHHGYALADGAIPASASP